MAKPKHSERLYCTIAPTDINTLSHCLRGGGDYSAHLLVIFDTIDLPYKINLKVAPYSYSCLSNNSVKQAYSCRTQILFDLVAILVT